ncbi:MAG: FkbM family methyltransferase [Anaerolineales bacterium]|nr:FkbM family methyltransferase [Anaerolineales bacterium]
MANSNFVWHKLRQINKLPGAYRVYQWIMKMYLCDGQLVKIKRGPIAGYSWRHYQCYQPWMALGSYEPDVANFIFSRLQPSQCFFDVGANAGYFTLIGAKKVGPKGKVIAFDPVPQNVKTIQEQVALNDLKGFCWIESLAISSFNGKTKLTIPDRNANAHLTNIEAPHVKSSNHSIIEVECVTLDDYITNHESPDFIKVDIEGAEVEALRGAVKLMRKAPEWLITAHSAELADEVVDLLKAANYQITDFPHMIHGIPSR